MNRAKWILSAVLPAIAMVLLTPGSAQAATPAENKEIVRAMAAAINARDLPALDGLVAADVKRHCDATPGLVIESLEQFKEFLESDFQAVPDSVQTIHQLLAEGDLVALRATYAGTQQGAFGPFPASGKRLELTFIGIVRLEEGKVAEIWVEWDNLNALTQLGHFPPPAGEAAQGQSPMP